MSGELLTFLNEEYAARWCIEQHYTTIVNPPENTFAIILIFAAFLWIAWLLIKERRKNKKLMEEQKK